MPTITISKHFDASAEMAFETITDFANAPEFIGGIKEVNILTEGPISVGSKIKETRIMMGREATEEMEVTTMDAPNHFVVEAFSRGTSYVTDYKIIPEGEGANVTLIFKATPQTLLAKILAALFSKMISTVADLMEKDLIDAAQEAKRRQEALNPA